MQTIIKHTLTNAWRSRYLQIFVTILLVAFIISAINNVLVLKTKNQKFELAKSEVRQAWLNQAPQNPHNAAHYGHFVFKPVYAVQVLDDGIGQFAGSILRLEAHSQNDPKFSAAEGRTESSRFGEISFSWLLQIVIPLFIIILCFNAVSADREQENLKLLAAQGISNKIYLAAKILANFLIINTLATVGLIVQWAAVKLLANTSITTQDFVQGTVWYSVYLLYFLLIVSLSVIGSGWVQSSKNSLLLQIATWVLLLIIMPKLTANIGAQLYPLQQRTAFERAFRIDEEKGINGHDPESDRYKKFEDSLLKKYKVDSVSQLPVNVDGLTMDAGENYANMVYDKHFGKIRNTIKQQNSISKYGALINPFLAVRNLSMGLSQSDYQHQLKFLEDAENYRRYLMSNLNLKMAYGGSKTNDWDWKVDAAYWKTVKDFDYHRPSFKWSLAHYTYEVLILLIWTVVSGLLFVLTAKKMKLL